MGRPKVVDAEESSLISVTVNSSLLYALDEYAESTGASRGRVMREAMYEFMETLGYEVRP